MRATALIAALVAALLAAAAPGWAVSDLDGDLLATFSGGISPAALPRDEPAPVTVRVAGNVRSVSGHADTLPQLRGIRVAINRRGQLFDRGLPVCRARQIQPATPRNARRACGDAIIGDGSVVVQVRIPGQEPFKVRAAVLVFNGPRSNGRKLILAQAYARNPPGSFVLTFRVSRKEGTYGTVLTTRLPTSTRRWAYLTHFDLRLRRVYTHRGERHSYASAACAAPDGFSVGVYPFARATYRFADGRRLTLSESGVCRVSTSPSRPASP